MEEGFFPPPKRACLVSSQNFSRQGELFTLKSARRLQQDTSMNDTNILELSIMPWAELEGWSAIFGSNSSVTIVARAV